MILVLVNYNNIGSHFSLGLRFINKFYKINIILWNKYLNIMKYNFYEIKLSIYIFNFVFIFQNISLSYYN